MAILCVNCGQTISKNDAHFCSHCGTVVLPQPVQSQTSNVSNNVSVSEQARRSKPVLREQIAQQPPFRPVSHSLRQKPPQVMPDLLPLTEGDSVKDLPITPQTIPVAGGPSVDKETIEHHPTLLLGNSPAEQPASQSDGAAQSGPMSDEVEDIDTSPLLVRDEIEESDTMQLAPQFAEEASILAPRSTVAQEQRRGLSPAALRSAFSPQIRLGRGLPVAIVLALLLVLLVGGVSTWIWLVQPFSVPTITQPEQRFQDADLGISLQYPTGWQTQIERGKSTIHFFDSSHTAQVNVVVANNAGSDLNRYLQQQAMQLGMTNEQASTSGFAGITWQAIQGSLVQDGANYTGAIFAAAHGERIITITQLAPQSVYSDEEKLIFSSMRTSLQFS